MKDKRFRGAQDEVEDQIYNIRLWYIFILMIIVSLYGCGKPDIPVSLKEPIVKLSEAQYPVFGDDFNKSALTQSLGQSILYFNRVPSKRTFKFAQDVYDARHMLKTLEVFLDFLNASVSPSNDELAQFVKENFHVYRAAGQDDTSRVLFTGYYEPSIKGSLKKTPKYCFPVYTRPDDMVQVNLSLFSNKYRDEPRLTARLKGREVVPYYTRPEINALQDYDKTASVLVWLESRIDRFFLEIQGSGRVLLEGGGVMRLHYHTKNGHPYRSIGKYLIDKGEIAKKDMSMQAIRGWLEKNPQRMDEVLHYNPSFVFFKEEEGGPYGCLGVEVTPLRSIATDMSLFPRGALCFMETAVPSETAMELPDKWKNQSLFVLNQDTGGAIKGAGRADIFFGNGLYAEFAAGHMKHRGSLFFLVLKE